MATNGACNGGGKSAAGVVVPEIKFTKLFINGDFVDAASGTPYQQPCMLPLDRSIHRITTYGSLEPFPFFSLLRPAT
ncbi:hypothetical protein U9M48_018603 [Paspalum notatum var. saurae]|uniref:Uncharacterized protein n=1 Tax=Paspalum notatum var. saurae TaxID=547442 RepID=A0AAQ3WPU9_PASNO